MKNLAGIFMMSALVTGLAEAAPKIDRGRVVNVASNIPPGLPSYGVARGAIFAVSGDGLSGEPQQADYPLPAAAGLGGTSIQVTVGGTIVDAIMISTSPKQVKALLPSKTPLGDGFVTVTVNGEKSAPEPIRVVASSFGIFTQDQSGSGPAQALNNISGSEQPLNSRIESAQPGQTILLLGTGLGAVDFDETGRPAAGDLDVIVEVYAGGKPARVLYKGRSACCAGIDEIDFVVPDGVQGCSVPIVVRSGELISNYATLAISPDSKLCSDPNCFTSQDLQNVGKGAPLRIGSINLARTITRFDAPPPVGSVEVKTDGAGGSFFQYDASQFVDSQRLATQSLGSCSVLTSRLDASFPNAIPPKALDAGPVINVSGPKGSKQLAKNGGIYSSAFGGPEFLVAGDYTADNAAGGSDIGPFRATLTIAAPVAWTNADAISSVDRAQDLTLTWIGGGANDFVSITGSSISGGAEAAFYCLERASVGQFTVPSFVMQSLPVSETRNGEAQGGLSVSSSGGSRFTVAGLDVAYFTSSAARFKVVAFK